MGTQDFDTFVQNNTNPVTAMPSLHESLSPSADVNVELSGNDPVMLSSLYAKSKMGRRSGTP